MSMFKQLAEKMMGSKAEPGAPLEPIDNPMSQGPDEKKIVDYVRTKIDYVRQTSSRITLEQTYLTNVAYLMGYDGVTWNGQRRQFQNTDPKRPITRSRFKINKVLPTIQNRLSRLVQNPPKYDVRPESDSSEDKDCARLASDVIDDALAKQNFMEKQQDLMMTAMQGGVSYAQCVWDPTLGNPMYDPETEELIGYEGDIRIEILNCLEVFPDPLAKNLDDAQWVIKAKVRKLDYFKDRYPDRGQAVKEEGVWLLSSLYDLKSNALTSVGIAGAQTTEQQKNSAIELVYYEKRSKDYPNGRMIVCASGVLLEDKELPIEQIDLVKFDDILIGGRYNSEAIITHLRSIQDQYNVTRTKCADWIRKTLGGKYIAAKGAGLSQEAINDQSGEVVEYNPVAGAAPPMAMQIPVIPQYVYEDLQVLDQEFNFVSGLSEAAQGNAPSSSMPWRGMELLVEQNQTRISVQTNRNEIGYARLASIILRYIGKYYEMPRMLKLAGDGLSYTVKEFKGADLKNNYDVLVVPGSTAPNSKVMKRQNIMNAFQTGLLGNPADPEVRARVLSMIEFGDENEIWKSQALDKQQVKKSIDMIEQGIKPTVHEWDNHKMFIFDLNEYRKTDKFDELDDRSKGLLNLCVEEHINFMVSLANPQVAQQQQMAQHMVNTMEQNSAMQPGSQPPASTPLTPGPQDPGQPIGA